MKKTNESQKDLSIEERKKILLNAIENQAPGLKKKDALLMPFLDEIKLMLKKKMSINSQLKALTAAGIKISYRTYKLFLDSIDAVPEITAGEVNPVKKNNNENKTIVLNDKGAVKTYAVKDAIKKLGFAWDKDRKGWIKEVNPEELESVKELKVGYNIIN